MAQLILLLQTYGVLIVFAVVLLEQIGLPIPAFPILIVAGALAMVGDFSWPACLAVSLVACLISDFFWYFAGRHYGKRILKLLCKISLSPDYCVSQTEDNFNRYGPKALIVAKFIPGFNTIAPPLAGAMGTGTGLFLAYSILGSLLWSGVGIAIGAYFHTSVDQVLDVLSTMGSTALMVLLALLALFIIFKYWERRRFQEGMQVERVGVDELLELIDGGHDPILVDARSITAQKLESSIPGAVIFHSLAPGQVHATIPKDRHVVVYCSCPNDVSAAQVAKQLQSQGYRLARTLHGGLDAWNARQMASSPTVITG